ncbi:GGDEF domain-containing protein [Deinococcus peraridilitoris]|nr:GGDEF domain-containing protein [Deinococcus peraridilitoris]
MSSSLISPPIRTSSSQSVRLRRTLYGSVTHLCTATIVLGCYLMGMLEGSRAVHYGVLIVLINLIFVALIASGLNLRFRDPSMTAAQVFISLWPSIYVMYYLGEPQARMAFLLMGTVGMLFGVFALNFRGLFLLGVSLLLAYLALLAVFVAREPARIDLRVEVVIVFAYAVVLILVASLGNQMTALRRTLKERNRKLETALSELEELATRDSLTRLPNRRALLERLLQEIARMERQKSSAGVFCVCLLDIDFFKRVNDTFGHQTGDETLCLVAGALQHAVRRSDFVGRFGGEEFLLVLTEGTPEAALLVAERVRVTVAALQIPGQATHERISASLGVTAYRPGESIETTIARADRALYCAKHQGRNRVVYDG